MTRPVACRAREKSAWERGRLARPCVGPGTGEGPPRPRSQRRLSHHCDSDFSQVLLSHEGSWSLGPLADTQQFHDHIQDLGLVHERPPLMDRRGPTPVPNGLIM